MMATPQQAPTVAEEDGVEVEMVTVAQTYTPKCSDEKRSKQLKARRGRGRKKKAIKDVPVPPPSPSFDIRVLPIITTTTNHNTVEQNKSSNGNSTVSQSDFDVTATISDDEATVDTHTTDNTAGHREAYSNITPDKTFEQRAAVIDIDEEGGVKNACDKLNSAKDARQLLELKKDFQESGLEYGEDPDEWIADLSYLREEMGKISVSGASTVTETDMILHILSNLPSQYDEVTPKLHDRLEAGTLTLDTVRTKLRMEDNVLFNEPGQINHSNSPTSQLGFDIMATTGDDNDVRSKQDHSHDAFEIQRKTQAMRDLDVLLADGDDESVRVTFAPDVEEIVIEKSTSPPPTPRKSKPRNDWLFSCTLDDIDEVVEDIVSPFDIIASFISCERDDSIIIDHMENDDFAD
ncbi:hypothetical protein QTG54_006314 [Skeletonema marinoi]|uniref:Uncharacterized protein n=1 Tax=Skeletonema marinoi TaxID=267567 RepID=A0AAD8YC31_9STRA|nr:hypothetical protein QTG54_006314 [Skeletonema marinoi]